MRIHKSLIAIGLVLAFGLLFELAAHASDFNEQVKITFAAPVQIPGRVLPAGTYVFQRADEQTPDIIHVFNADGSVLEATLETIPAERAEPAGDTVVTLAKAAPGTPDHLVNYFYPGRTDGHEFVYARHQQRQVASAPQRTVMGNGSTSTAEAAGD